ncbi:cytochrome P450 [Tricholoma matsutake]|nr:cytochrome P450 [Tricholoma matsutake 945]KAF8231565.1 cytochrome P450 [Tricholoma matsutake 945]
MFEAFTEPQISQPWVGALVVCAVTYLISYWRGRPLDHIPTVGSSSHLLSFIGAVEYLFNGPAMTQRGYDQHRYSIFKLPTFGRWMVVVAGSKLIDELRKVPEDVLSFNDAVDEDLHISYTLGPRIGENPYHIPIIQSKLSSNLTAMCIPLQDEIVAACKDIITVHDHEWSKFRGMETLMEIICRASNRIFVGAPLCREAGFTEAANQYTNTIAKSSAFLSLLPSFLVPPVGYFLGRNISTNLDRTAEYLGPIIEDRKRKIEEYGPNYPGKPNDMLTWLIDEAKGEETSTNNLTRRILTVIFASINTSSLTLLHALYYLAANPEYSQVMRDEIKQVVDNVGWNHAAVKQMTTVDSFIKESQRLNSLGSLMMHRVARQPFTFQDGTYIPQGTHIYVAAHPIHLDDTNYTDPTEFKPFRFVNKEDEHNKTRKLDMTTTQADFLPFGHGRHACPGRFFAAEMLKLTLAHIIMNYDVKLEGEHPKNTWILSTCLPNTTAEVMFRKRKE